MKLSAKFFTVSTLILASLSLASCGGKPSDQYSTYSPGIKVAQVGQSYTLEAVKYTAGSNYSAAQHPGFVVTLTIDSDKTIAGKMFCNDYSAQVIWQKDNTLNTWNYSVGSTVCGANQPANPIAFSNKMYFTFGTNELDISDFAGTFTAVFTQTQ